MQFKNDSIIICSSAMKRKLLEQYSGKFPLFHATYFDLKTFKEKYEFEISNKDLVKAMEILNVSYANAKVITPYIYYVDENGNNYNDKKIMQLQNLKGKLNCKNNAVFKKFLEGKDIYIFELFLDRFSLKLLKKLSNKNNVYYVSEKDLNRIYDETKLCDFTPDDKYIFSKDPKVHYQTKFKHPLSRDVMKFKTYDKEVEYVFTQISKILRDEPEEKRNEKINNIYIWSNSTAYNHMISRYSDIFNIPVNIKETESIKNHETYKKFYQSLCRGVSKEKAIAKIYPQKETYEYKAIVSLVNDYHFIDGKELAEVLKVEIENIKYESTRYSNSVRVVSDCDGFKEDDHVFLIGFDSNTYPVTYKDEDYLPSSYKDKCDITTHHEKNELELNKAVYTISKIKNLYLSFSENTSTKNAVSLANKVLKYKEVKYEVDEATAGTIHQDHIPGLLNQLNRASFIDKQIEQDELKGGFADYDSYNPQFREFNDEEIKDLMEILKDKNTNKPKVHLSYTSMDEFNKCHFKYYLNRVLKIKHDQDRVATEIGNIFHALLEKNDKEVIDLEVEKQEILNKEKNIVVRYYFNKFWDDFKLIIDFNNRFKENTTLKDVLAESQLIVKFEDENVDKHFEGKIDKIIFQKDSDGKEYIAIIDYKTGNNVATLDNIEYGLNLQLPSYAYLVTKGNFTNEEITIKNPVILGLYLQKVLQKVDYKINKVKYPIDEKTKNLKLEGYSILENSTERPLLTKLEPNYVDSKYIKNLTYDSKNKKFGQHAKFVTARDISLIVNIVEEKINEAFAGILSGDFGINPKKIGSKNVSCEYCPYENICYVDQYKIKRVKKKAFDDLSKSSQGEEEQE